MKYDFETETMRKLFDGHLDVAVLTAEAFIESIDSLITKCDQDFVTKDISQCQKTIHQLKGAVALLGKSKLLDQVKEVEQFLKQNNFENATANYKNIKLETENFKNQLQVFVNNNQG